MMYNGKTIDGIVLGAGQSTRFGGKTRKQFCEISGKTVLAMSVDGFKESAYIDNIIVTSTPDFLCEGVSVVDGGKCRLMSMKNAIEHSCADYVVTHDGNRPLIDGNIIDGLIDDFMGNYDKYLIGLCFEKIYDSILKVDGTFANRDEYVHIQTPTIIKRDTAMWLFDNYYSDKWNNLWEMIAESGAPEKILFHKGAHKLMKITTREDLETIKKLI
jgi:2-C-methyl-D-erythritol 4-phosphate cytidylyltransferase